MTDRYLHHVTLTTGHVRRSPRSEVGAGVVERLTPYMLDAIREREIPVALPAPPGYSMTAWAPGGRCLVVTLWHAATQLILTTGVAAHSRCGARLWPMLHQPQYELATDAATVPAEPWCADRIEPAALLHREALEWTGDWSRCIAWAWIEHVETRSRSASCSS